MGQLCGKYEVFYAGADIGTVTISSDGLVTHVMCRCRRISDEVLRLFCSCGDNNISLGVLLPEGDTLTLSRRFTKNDLAAMGIAAPESFFLAAPGAETPPGWRAEQDPARLFQDAELAAVCGGVSGCMLRQEADKTLLAVPFSSGTPFPMMPVFCFGEWETIAGRDYLIFALRDGRLI